MLAKVAAYALLGLFFALERFLRTGAEAKALERGQFDRGSTLLVGAAFNMPFLLAPLLNRLGLGRMRGGGVVGWSGVFIAGAGLVLRVTAMRMLGAAYTRTLRVSERQRVVRSGVYRFVRHPGYLATILVWTGAALALANWVATALTAATLFLTYRYRIRAEERMLVATFGREYTEYAARTRRLIPFLY
jgi:protein-S-isoprenylcysteine O-methyltransferase